MLPFKRENQKKSEFLLLTLFFGKVMNNLLNLVEMPNFLVFHSNACERRGGGEVKNGSLTKFKMPKKTLLNKGSIKYVFSSPAKVRILSNERESILK